MKNVILHKFVFVLGISLMFSSPSSANSGCQVGSIGTIIDDKYQFCPYSGKCRIVRIGQQFKINQLEKGNLPSLPIYWSMSGELIGNEKILYDDQNVAHSCYQLRGELGYFQPHKMAGYLERSFIRCQN